MSSVVVWKSRTGRVTVTREKAGAWEVFIREGEGADGTTRGQRRTYATKQAALRAAKREAQGDGGGSPVPWVPH